MDFQLTFCSAINREIVFEMQSNLKFPSGQWGPRLSLCVAAGASDRGVPGRSMLTGRGGAPAVH